MVMGQMTELTPSLWMVPRAWIPDGDGIGNNADTDDDGDGTDDAHDAFPLDAGETRDTEW